jgi:hypothetical protein
MWAAGMAGSIAVVIRWRIVGPGFLWVAVGSTILVGVATAFGGAWGVAAVGLLALTMLIARQPTVATTLLGAAAIAFAAGSLSSVRPILLLSGAVALGGVTVEMLLGHWYLVDPRLPRWALKKLDAAAIAGLVIDAALVGVYGGLNTGNVVLTSAFALLSTGSILLMVGVWFSIKEEGYDGIMAATGLSYLAVLTSLGAVALGRVLVSLAANT